MAWLSRKYRIVLGILIVLVLVVGAAYYLVTRQKIHADTTSANSATQNGSFLTIKLPKDLADYVKSQQTSASSSRAVQTTEKRLNSITDSAIQQVAKGSAASRAVQNTSGNSSTFRDFIVLYQDEKSQLIQPASISSRSQTSCQPDSNQITVNVATDSVPATLRDVIKTEATDIITKLRTYLGAPLVNNTVTIGIASSAPSGDPLAYYESSRNRLIFISSAGNDWINDDTQRKPVLAHELVHAFQDDYIGSSYRQEDNQMIVEGMANAVGTYLVSNGRLPQPAEDQGNSTPVTSNFLLNRGAQYSAGADFLGRLYLENNVIFKTLECAFYKGGGVSATTAHTATSQLLSTIEGQPLNSWWSNWNIFSPRPANGTARLSLPGYNIVYLYRDNGTLTFLSNQQVSFTAVNSSNRTFDVTCTTDTTGQINITACLNSMIKGWGSGPQWAKIHISNSQVTEPIDAILVFNTNSNPIQKSNGSIVPQNLANPGYIKFTSLDDNVTSIVPTTNGTLADLSSMFSGRDSDEARRWKIEYVCNRNASSLTAATYRNVVMAFSNVLLPTTQLSNNKSALTYTEQSRTNKIITFTNSNSAAISVTISGLNGRVVRTASTNTNIDANSLWSYTWNGRDNSNRPVAKGVYTLTVAGTDQMCRQIRVSKQITVNF